MRPVQRSKRGNVALVIGLCMFMLVLLAALAIDLGMARTQRGQLQTALDGAALAGASYINDGTSATSDAAIEVAGLNKVGNQNVAITAGDVDIGWFNPITDTFQTTSCTWPCKKAVRVQGSVGMGTIFGSVTGVSSINIGTEAIATGSPEPIECALFGDSSFLVFGSGRVDSYDSTDCTSPPCNYCDLDLDTCTDPTEANSLENGDTCTNGQGEVQGAKAEVCGDASSGTGLSTLTHDGGSVCGATGGLTEVVSIPSPCGSSNQDNGNYPPATCNDCTVCSGTITSSLGDTVGWPASFDTFSISPALKSTSDLKISSGGPYTIPPGRYEFDSLSVNGDELIIDPDGYVEFWVRGDADWHGNPDANADPHQMLVVSAGDMTLNGTSATSGTFYSYGDMTFGGTTDFEGVFVSWGDLKVGGTGDIHLDESLPGIIEAEIIEGPPILVF